MSSRSRLAIRRPSLAVLVALTWVHAAAPTIQAQSPSAPKPDLPPLTPAAFSAQFGGASYPMAVAGRRAVLGVGPRAHVLDVGDTDILGLGETPVMDGIVRAVALDGDVAFVGIAGSGGLHAFDISTPEAPRAVADVPTRGEVRNLVVTADVVYAAVFGGLRVYRRPQPGALEEVAVDLPFRGVVAAALHGETLFVLEPTIGLHAVSLADPTAPVPGTILSLSGIAADAAADMRVADDTLYIAADRQVFVVDIADPSAPSVVTTLAARGTITDLDVRGDRLAVAEMEAGTTVYDIADPHSPVALAQQATVQGNSSVAWSEDGALLATDWLASLSRRRLTADGLAAPDAVYGATTFVDSAVALGDGTIAVTAALARLMTLSQATAGTPGVLDIVQSLDLPPTVRSTRVLTSGNRLAVLAPHGGIWLYALDGNTVGELAGTLSLAAFGGAPLDGGSALAVAGGESGLHILAIAPDELRRLVTVPTDVFIGGVAALGNLVAVADRTAGLRIFDVADLEVPREIGTAPSVGPAMDVAIVGDAAFVVTQNGAVEAFDIVDPTRPTSRGAVSLGGGALRVVASGTTLYVLVDEHTVVPVDARRLDALVVGAAYPLSERIGDLSAADGRVYVAAGKLGLLVGELPVMPRDDGVGATFNPAVDAPGAVQATAARVSTATAGAQRRATETSRNATPSSGAEPSPLGAPGVRQDLAIAALVLIALIALGVWRAASRWRRSAGT